MKNIDLKEIKKVAEARNISRKKIMEITEKVIEIAEKYHTKKAYDEIELKTSDAYGGCWETYISIGYYGELEKPIIIAKYNEWLKKWEILEPTLKYENRYICEDSVFANTEEIKNFIIEQIKNIKEHKNYEEEMLEKIKETIFIDEIFY